MAVIKRNTGLTKHDDAKSRMGVSTTKDAVDKLDERLDLIEEINIELGNKFNWVQLPIQLYTKRTNISSNNQAGWLDLGNNIEAVVFADYRQQSISTQVTLGKNYKAGDPLHFILNWLPLSNSTGNVVIHLDWIAGKNPKQGDFMNGNTIRKTMLVKGNGYNSEYLQVSLTGDSEFGNDLVPGSTIAFTLTRDGDDNRDTFYGSICMLSAYFEHKNSAVTEEES